MNQPCAAMSSPRVTKFPWIKFLLVLTIILFLATSVSVATLYLIRNRSSTKSTRKPTVAISRTCGKTRYPNICVESLVEFPGALSAGESDLVHMSLNLTLQRFERALSLSSKLINLDMDSHARSAYADCIELLQDSYEHLLRSLASVATSPNDHNVGTQPSGSIQDVHTWLSATLTNQNTCDEGLREVKGSLKDQMEDKLQNLWELASNSLAIYLENKGDNNYFSGIPIQKTHRKLKSSDDSEIRPVKEAVPEQIIEKDLHFPMWMNGRDRALMDLPAAAIYADIVVAWDGSGDCKTIAEAILKAPENSDRRIIIYVKAGRYEEDHLNVGRKKTNLMFIGDGKGKTVITGHKNAVVDNISTFRTATFAATGYGFIARDITFENYAGPTNHQAVALRVNADHAVVYRCEVLGYQDTLYVHSQRQFYRECDIYGTVDCIFGNAAVVFQNCNIYARKPMMGQKNSITAQNRKDPNQNTGISIHMCKILAAPDLEESKDIYPTFLGRPWNMYARTVYMLSYMGDHISPKGWLEWSDTFALDTLFYAEYMNNGPGANVSERVTWRGYRVMESSAEATPFTVASLIEGLLWLPSTGVAFFGGLTN